MLIGSSTVYFNNDQKVMCGALFLWDCKLLSQWLGVAGYQWANRAKPRSLSKTEEKNPSVYKILFRLLAYLLFTNVLKWILWISVVGPLKQQQYDRCQKNTHNGMKMIHAACQWQSCHVIAQSVTPFQFSSAFFNTSVTRHQQWLKRPTWNIVTHTHKK